MGTIIISAKERGDDVGALAPATTGEEIAQRAETGWPLDEVPYDQGAIWNDDDGRTDEDGYRRDCSGFHSMAQGLPAPGPSTVGLVNYCHRIEWAELRRGDFVMLGGPGTAGDNGHTSVVVRVNRATNRYTVLHQGGGLGPQRWTGPIGTAVRAGMVPYRSNYISEGEDMPMYGVAPGDDTVWAGDGVHCRPVRSEAGIVGGFAAVQEFPSAPAMFDRLGVPVSEAATPTTVDVQAIAKAVNDAVTAAVGKLRITIGA